MRRLQRPQPQPLLAGLLLALALALAGPLQAGFTMTWNSGLSDDNRGVAWADFDNDCRPDIITVSNQPGTCVRVYRNDGGGSFTLMYTSPELDRNTGVAVADYDGD